MIKHTPHLRGVSFNSYPVCLTALSAMYFDLRIPGRHPWEVRVQGE